MITSYLGKLKLIDSRLQPHWQTVGRSPRSKWLNVTDEEYLLLARCGDHADERSGQVHRDAKLLLERDRAAWLQEQHGYRNIFFSRIEPLTASPKNDLIYGWP